MMLSSKDELGTEPSAPRTASRQQRRANASHDRSEEHYHRNLFIPFLDHITQEMSSRFGSTQKTAVQLLGLVQSSIVAGTNVDIAEVPEVYMSDLPSPQTLDIEYDR
ncbi:hypothetical protein pdam_00004575 [Pocillopora damicornis]|uniref:Uncharacterized protein n=1 Tax=Pocillopora damicornis TaxID=46731 RepID=A0A3M6ULG3_POCDA|nr:hypothetical protein pdam_00004575 [Pocillopora damicornis]